MSHEIRTPMNGILGMNGLLSETDLTPEQRTYSSAIEHSARTLLSLIDEILDFSRVEAGKLVLDTQPFSLEACLQEAAELLAPQAHEKSIELAWTVDPRLPASVVGDEGRVRQIVLNLLSNAVKFTDTGGVLISATGFEAAGGGHDLVRLQVEDSGIGMSEADRERLFGEFEQADQPVRRQSGGTGLGLAISRQLAVAMGGDISVASTLGRGSVCTVELPLPQAAGPVRPSMEIDAGIASHLRVLLAFDWPLERRAMAHALTACGVTVTECKLSRAHDLIALAARDGQPFNRIVVDAEGDEATVTAALDLARRLEPARAVSGIVLANLLSRANLSKLRTRGFGRYLVRPARPISLLIQLGLVATESSPTRSTCPAETTPAISSQEFGRGHVLLVEDNDINALLARRHLEKSGCSHVLVRDGRAAVDAVLQTTRSTARPFDLILMDVQMPIMDGLSATRMIRAADPGKLSKLPPIVAMTANAFAEDRARCVEAGMCDYISKPFDRVDLEKILNSYLPRQSSTAAA